jgi:hypothetical protein
MFTKVLVLTLLASTYPVPQHHGTKIMDSSTTYCPTYELFLCHINDLPNSVKSSVRLFADDCLLYREINRENDHTTLQNDLNNLKKWASDWGMHFNAKNCYILSMKKKSHHSYTLNNQILEQVPSNSYLGLQVPSNPYLGLQVPSNPYLRTTNSRRPQMEGTYKQHL